MKSSSTVNPDALAAAELLSDARRAKDPDFGELRDGYSCLAEQCADVVPGSVLAAAYPERNRGPAELAVRKALGPELAHAADHVGKGSPIQEIEADVLAGLWARHSDDLERGIIGSFVIACSQDYALDDSDGRFLSRFTSEAERLLPETSTWADRHALSRLIEMARGPESKSSLGIPDRDIQNFETQKPEKNLPRLKDIRSDTKRNSIFGYFEQDGSYHEMTERQGINQLYEFLQEYIDARANGRRKEDDTLLNVAQSLRDNMVFVGVPELVQATHTIAQVWRRYLQSDPKNILCVLTEVGNLHKYEGKKKSDEYLRDTALAAMTRKGLEEVGDRIFLSIEELEARHPDAKEQNIRVVLFDDWMLSGRQMKSVYEGLISKSPFFRELSAAGRVEINLIAANKTQLRNGLKVSGASSGHIPVKAVYEVNDVDKHNAGLSGLHITGIHSTTNYDCGDQIKRMREELGEVNNPALSVIDKSYRWRMPRQVVATEDGVRMVLDAPRSRLK